MIVHHGSLSLIKNFKFNENGVHFGGLFSAYEAVLRKCEDEYKNIFIYKCQLKTKKTFLSEDVGSSKEWRKVIMEAKKYNYQVIKYINKYEPDISHSFIVLDPECIEISSCFLTNSLKVEKELIKVNNLYV